jgi:hypothetical protein
MQDLIRASGEISKLRPEHRGWEVRINLMFRLFPNERIKGAAVEFRLAAMSHLIRSGALAHWVQPTAPDGSTSIAESVWIATAAQPLRLSDNGARFDPASFIEAVLNAVQEEGRDKEMNEALFMR